MSLEDQAGRIRDYCETNGWTLAELVTDDGVSGGRRERLVRLEETVKRRQAGVVVVYHLDRFARDVAGMLDSLRAFSKRGVELHVVGRGRVEAETASGFLMAGIEGVLAEHYRRLIGEKTRDALAGLRAKGRRVSRFAPYGYRVGKDGLTLEPEPEEEAALALVRELAPGRSLRALSAALAAEGVIARNRRPFAAKVLRTRRRLQVPLRRERCNALPVRGTRTRGAAKEKGWGRRKNRLHRVARPVQLACRTVPGRQRRTLREMGGDPGIGKETRLLVPDSGVLLESCWSASSSLKRSGPATSPTRTGAGSGRSRRTHTAASISTTRIGPAAVKQTPHGDNAANNPDRNGATSSNKRLIDWNEERIDITV